MLNKKLITIDKQLFITIFGSENYYKHLKVKIVKIGRFLMKLYTVKKKHDSVASGKEWFMSKDENWK